MEDDGGVQVKFPNMTTDQRPTSFVQSQSRQIRWSTRVGRLLGRKVSKECQKLGTRRSNLSEDGQAADGGTLNWTGRRESLQKAKD